MAETPTDNEIAEAAELSSDILIHHHKGKKACIAIDRDHEPHHDRVMVTLHRLLRIALEED